MLVVLQVNVIDLVAPNGRILPRLPVVGRASAHWRVIRGQNPSHIRFGQSVLTVYRTACVSLLPVCANSGALLVGGVCPFIGAEGKLRVAVACVSQDQTTRAYCSVHTPRSRARLASPSGVHVSPQMFDEAGILMFQFGTRATRSRDARAKCS